MAITSDRTMSPEHHLYKRVQRAISDRHLGSLANATKWREFEAAIGPYHFGSRFKLVFDSEPRTDNEWIWSGAFPWEALAWVEFSPTKWVGSGLPDRDHSAEVEASLRAIGLEFRKTDDGFRVFGYGPLHEVDK